MSWLWWTLIGIFVFAAALFSLYAALILLRKKRPGQELSN